MRRARPAVRALALLASLLVAAPGVAASPPAGPSLVAQGKELFGRTCIACHGAGGAGITRPSNPIGFAPGRVQEVQRGYGPSLRGVGAAATDFYLRTGYMPLKRAGDQPRRHENLLFDDGEIRALVAYVASLGRGPAVPVVDPARGSVSDGMRLFTEHCAGCHQIVAQGGYVTGAVAPPLTDATPTQIAEAVRIGPYVMPKFDRRAISDPQLASIIRYVESTKSPDDRGGWGIGHIGPVPEGLVAWFLAGTVLVVTCIVIGTRIRRREG